MALIPCPDCGTAVSDISPACLHCGRPIASNVGVRQWAQPSPTHTPYAPVVAQPAGGPWWSGLKIAAVLTAVAIGSGILVFLVLAIIGLSSPETPVARAPIEDHPSIAIRSLLQADLSLGASLDQDLRKMPARQDGDLHAMALRIRRYTTQADAIPRAALPADFAEAYVRHLGAWGQLADSLEAYPHIASSDEQLGGLFLHLLNGDAASSMLAQDSDQREGLQKLQSAQSEIRRSYVEVKASAAHYGAQ